MTDLLAELKKLSEKWDCDVLGDAMSGMIHLNGCRKCELRKFISHSRTQDAQPSSEQVDLTGPVQARAWNNGFELAHELQKCGHSRGDYRDPNYKPGAAESNYVCIGCEREAALIKRCVTAVGAVYPDEVYDDVIAAAMQRVRAVGDKLHAQPSGESQPPAEGDKMKGIGLSNTSISPVSSQPATHIPCTTGTDSAVPMLSAAPPPPEAVAQAMERLRQIVHSEYKADERPFTQVSRRDIETLLSHVREGQRTADEIVDKVRAAIEVCFASRETFSNAWAEQVRQLRDVCKSLKGTLLAAPAAPLRIPDGLHPKTASLVADFSSAMAEKLLAAEKKYGYKASWADQEWSPDEIRRHLREHMEKGDPRDVANYCAFLWYRSESTSLRSAPRDGLREALELAKQRVEIVERVMKLPYIKATRDTERGEERFVARDDLIKAIHDYAAASPDGRG